MYGDNKSAQITKQPYDLYHDDDQLKRLQDLSRDPRLIEDPDSDKE